MTNHKDHSQKTALHSGDEESSSAEPVDSSDDEAFPVDQQQEEPHPDLSLPQEIAPRVHTPYIVVSERHEVVTSVGPTTVIFRPGQHLSSPHLIELARINNIATRED